MSLFGNLLKKNHSAPPDEVAVGEAAARPLVSVIVPVYNAEAFLNPCVDSILNQTLGQFELILVDDASTDGSLRLCEEFAGTDPRITVLHNDENHGPAFSRKTGIGIAKGDYIQFVDSDDYIDKKALEKLHACAVKGDYDLVVFDNNWITQNESVYVEQSIDTSIVDDDDTGDSTGGNISLIKKMLMGNAFIFSCVVWNKFVKRNIFDNPILFPDITYSEDKAISSQVLFYAQNIGHLGNSLYYHIVRANSLANPMDLKGRVKCVYDNYVSNTTVLAFFAEHVPDRIAEFEPYLANDTRGNLVELAGGTPGIAEKIDELLGASLGRVIEFLKTAPGEAERCAWIGAEQAAVKTALDALL